jgi:O-acetyl-ADP-ribose deacetylase (regulator of RNase III)
MKTRNKKSTVSALQVARDLETLIHGEAFGVNEPALEVPKRKVDIEEALKIFDALRKPAKPRNSGYWRHPSVLALREDDPVSAIVSRARRLVLDSMEKGWAGPPYDPFALAQLRGIQLLPTEDVVDARTRSDSSGRFTIEFNPNRPAARMRYSVAHELGHTLFPDCAAAVRNRATHTQLKGNDWQLETLCNIAAAEILMPFGTLQEEKTIRPSIGMILELRQKYLVSCEAVINRLIRLTDYPCIGFAARLDRPSSRYRVEYRIKSPALPEITPIDSGYLFPAASKASVCTAPGATAKEEIRWESGPGSWQVEFLGISPNTGDEHPRIIGLAFPPPSASGKAVAETVMFIKGDARDPFGAGPKILVQIVNDKAVIWGGGFAKQVGKKWPQAQGDFRRWAYATGKLKLGNVHSVTLDPELMLATIVAQHGIGASTAGPRLRYGALFSGLERVAQLANANSATVHMPRIGAGEAGGSWNVIEGIIRETLTTKGLRVAIYDLPSRRMDFPRQPSIEFPQEMAGEVM